MKTALTLIGAALLIGALSAPARSEEAPGAAKAEPKAARAGEPGKMMKHHGMMGKGGVFQELRKDPSLASNPEFLKQHPRFAQWLERHPQAREQLAKNPEQFFAEMDKRREERMQRRREHREAFRKLRQDPTLATNQDFLKEHPRFAEWLDKTPAAREQLAKNPQQFFAEMDKRREQRRQRWQQHKEGRAPVPGEAPSAAPAP
jgi:hypothetical protein